MGNADANQIILEIQIIEKLAVGLVILDATKTRYVKNNHNAYVMVGTLAME